MALKDWKNTVYNGRNGNYIHRKNIKKIHILSLFFNYDINKWELVVEDYSQFGGPVLMMRNFKSKSTAIKNAFSYMRTH